MSIININSNDSIPIEQHFRVSAGPGAGKTYWLINHLRNVLSKSDRLGKTRKIACITFTNIAVQTILSRLETSSDNLEVSTIHSFLYRNVVKPYVHFIADEYSLNVEKMDGHDENIISNFKFIKEWKTKTRQGRINDDTAIVNAISKARWKFNASKQLEFKPNVAQTIDGLSLSNKSYYEYKTMAWAKGVLHHDDVLFFSLKIIEKYPFVLKILRVKFPYFFVDEFQDTNPIQVQIIKEISREETIIGIIGDRAQSIYSFQGADSSLFEKFKLDKIIDYNIVDNRRSTNEIVELLNHIRVDIIQVAKKNIKGDRPTIIYGKLPSCYEKAKSICMDGELNSLSRKNVVSNAMRRNMQNHTHSVNLLNELENKDSNYERKKIILVCIKAVELARQNNFKDSIRLLKKLFKYEVEDKNKKALSSLVVLLKGYDEFKDQKLLEFYTLVSEKVYTFAKVSKGLFKEFCETYTYQQLAIFIHSSDETSIHTTIHKAKGNEFDNVFLILKDEKDLSFIISPDLVDINQEEQRVNYVAVSRAKSRLFIYLPFLSDKIRMKLPIMVDIMHVNDQ